MTQSYIQKRDVFAAAFRARDGGPGAVRLSKRSSNLFRARLRVRGTALDAEALDGVISVDRDSMTADVEGMATYETIVDATLAEGLMPTVVPELKTITLGGAATGLGIESSSFRYGLVHDGLVEIEVLTGTGDVVVARPDNEHGDLFFGFPNSYGTLGYALRLRVDLVEVAPFVHVRHVRFDDVDDYFAEIERVCSEGSYDGEPVDFVDGTIFGRGVHYLTLGSFTSDAPWCSDYTGMAIYYQSIRRRHDDYLSVRDYIWRWDTDWFWCSGTFGVQNPYIRAWIPRRWLRSSNYWKVLAFAQRYDLQPRIDRLQRRPMHEQVIQDVEIPVGRAAEFLDFFHRELDIEPIWMCPTKARDPNVSWDLYPMDPTILYINFGFWSSAEMGPDDVDGDRNRLIERVVRDLGGSKSLYATSFYDEETFHSLYGGETYALLKKRYDPDGAFKTLYEKCVRRG